MNENGIMLNDEQLALCWNRLFPDESQRNEVIALLSYMQQHTPIEERTSRLSKFAEKQRSIMIKSGGLISTEQANEQMMTEFFSDQNKVQEIRTRLLKLLEGNTNKVRKEREAAAEAQAYCKTSA